MGAVATLYQGANAALRDLRKIQAFALTSSRVRSIKKLRSNSLRSRSAHLSTQERFARQSDLKDRTATGVRSQSRCSLVDRQHRMRSSCMKT
jgi:hypothetical protein